MNLQEKALVLATEELCRLIRTLPPEDLQSLTERVDMLVEGRTIASRKKMTRDQLVKLYEGSGYFTTGKSKFFEISHGDHGGLYGLQVGQYTHSCHIDNTDFIVLLVIDSNQPHSPSFIIDESDMWLKEIK